MYTESEGAGVALIEREVDAARAAGVEAQLTTRPTCRIRSPAPSRSTGQAQFHPWKYLAALARAVDGDGSHVFESTRATVSPGALRVETTEARSARASDRCDPAAVLDRGLFFAKAHPTTSYAIAAAIEESAAPRGMYISVDQPTRSVRSTAGEDGGRIVIVGGEGHKPGDEPDTRRCYERLESIPRRALWGERRDRVVDTRLRPLDRLPYIGRLRRDDERSSPRPGSRSGG